MRQSYPPSRPPATGCPRPAASMSSQPLTRPLQNPGHTSGRPLPRHRSIGRRYGNRVHRSSSDNDFIDDTTSASSNSSGISFRSADIISVTGITTHSPISNEKKDDKNEDADGKRGNGLDPPSKGWRYSKEKQNIINCLKDPLSDVHLMSKEQIWRKYAPNYDMKKQKQILTIY